MRDMQIKTQGDALNYTLGQFKWEQVMATGKDTEKLDVLYSVSENEK